MGWINIDDKLPVPSIPVLLHFINEYGKHRIVRAEWSDGHSLEMDWECDTDFGVYDEKTDTYYCKEGWYESNEFEEIHWMIDGNVTITHWMPLPDYPFNEQIGGE